jgi:pimeloyl-ACP methyl ester carboxylesterase
VNDIEAARREQPSTPSHQPCRLKSALALVGAAIGAATAANALIALCTPMAQSTLSGTFGRYQYRHGAIAYTVAGSGSPVLLLHGLGAGNSMAEWSANYEELKQHHTVYAVDFPGWGLSDKPQRLLTAEDYIEPILFFVEDIIGAPCAVIASSDACNFAVEAATRRPELFSKLVLVCPASRDTSAPAEVAAPFVQHLFHAPVLGRTLFNLFASRKTMRSFAERHLYFDKTRVTESLVTRYHIGAHQPGAENGFAAFISGALNHDGRQAWSNLAQPALLVWGRNTLINPLETAPEWLALKPDAELEVIDRAMLLPHTEHAAEFNARVLDWLK